MREQNGYRNRKEESQLADSYKNDERRHYGRKDKELFKGLNKYLLEDDYRDDLASLRGFWSVAEEDKK